MARNTSGTAVDSKLGRETFARSGGAVNDGDSLLLPAAGGGFEYGMYRYFVPMETSTEYCIAALDVEEGSQAWIGVSDFVKGAWIFHGPYTDDTQISLTPGLFLSMNGNFYLVVIACDGSTVTVHDTSFAYDDQIR